MLIKFLFLFLSWESQWWKNCAETASIPASSSWNPCWVLSSSGSSPIPSKRRRTSWRWRCPIWEAGSSRSSSSRPAWPPAWCQPVTATPGACRRPSASCPTVRSRLRPTDGCSATSRVCRPPARPATDPQPSPLPALHATSSAPAREWAKPVALCGDRGRTEAAPALTKITTRTTSVKVMDREVKTHWSRNPFASAGDLIVLSLDSWWDGHSVPVFLWKDWIHSGFTEHVHYVYADGTQSSRCDRTNCSCGGKPALEFSVCFANWMTLLSRPHWVETISVSETLFVCLN